MVQHKCSSYCPPNCPFVINYCNHPIQCDDYDCTNPKTCVQMIASDCVIYQGTTLQQYGIESGQSLTQVIGQLVNLLYPGCFSLTTTTTTVCQRPQGLQEFVFNNAITVGGVGPSIDFTASQILACQALDDFYNVPNSTLSGFAVDAESMTLGDTLYDGTAGDDCSVVPDGYYLSVALSSTQVYHVVGGILTEILNCP